MSAVQSSVPVISPTGLLDKYVLPKVALMVIIVASFIGTWLTMTTHGAGAWLPVSARWLHLLSFAFLAGGYMWKGLFVRRARRREQLSFYARFTTASFKRHRRITKRVLPIFVLSATYDLMQFGSWGIAAGLVWLGVVLLITIALRVGLNVFRRPDEDPFVEQKPARVILVLLLLYVLVQAAFDVTLAQAGRVWPLLLRGLHLTAFSFWFGGAVWNIFITVPAARSVLSMPVVLAASQQLERFRLAVRVFLPALVITGFLQAYPYIGLSLRGLTASTFGWLILTKILLVGVLIVVFLTCPMWRACSPISGMCKLDDMKEA